MRFKKGNRWKSSSGELKYRTWRKMVFELNKRTTRDLKKDGDSIYRYRTRMYEKHTSRYK